MGTTGSKSKASRYGLDGLADGAAVDEDIDNETILASVDPTFKQKNRDLEAQQHLQNLRSKNSMRRLGSEAARSLSPQQIAESHYRADVPLPAELVLTDILKRLCDHWKLRNSELLYFWNQFCKLDTDNSGTIEQVEFFLFLREPRTRVLNYIMPIIVPNDVDQLHFSNWICAVFGFCFLTEREVLEHVFAKYDSSRTGKLLQNDLFKFIKHMHADNPLFPKDVVLKLANLLQENGGYYDFETFVRVAHKYPMFVYPIYRIQQQMRNRVIGIELFRRIDERSGDVYMNRTIGDRPKHFYTRRTLQNLLLYCCSWPCCCCCLPSYEEITAAQQRRATLKKEKMKTALARAGNIIQMEEEILEKGDTNVGLDVVMGGLNNTKNAAGKDAEEKEQFNKEGAQDNNNSRHRNTVKSRLISLQLEMEEKQTNAAEVEQYKSSHGNVKDKLNAVVSRLKGVTQANILDVYDSDADSVCDEFEDYNFDQYPDSKPGNY
jgi:Ca2+-binding EF-hand superfamily protein